MPTPVGSAPSVAREGGVKRRDERLALAAFFYLGCGMLAPWNACISAVDYYAVVYPSRSVDRIVTVAYLPACLATLGAMTARRSGSAGAPLGGRSRLLVGYFGFALMMAAMPLVDVLLVGGAPEGPPAALALLVAGVVAVGVLDGVAQGALYAEASHLPQQCTHAIVSGTASSGLLICLARLATKAAAEPTRAGLRASANVFFAMTAALCAGCAVLVGWGLPRLAAVAAWRRARWLEIADGRVLPLDRSCSADPDGGGGDDVALLRPTSTTPERDGPALSNSSSAAAHATTSPLSLAPPPAPPPAPPLRAALAAHWRPCAAIAAVYVVSLSIFPGFLAEDVHSAALGSWYPLLLFTAFNAADLAGKTSPFGATAARAPTGALLVASLARAAFLPLFMLAARAGTGPGAWLIALLTVLLGLSNGFLTALIQTRAPVGLPPDEAELVAGLVVFSLVAGLMVGAFASWLWLL